MAIRQTAVAQAYSRASWSNSLFSFSCWVRFTSNPASGNDQSIMGRTSGCIFYRSSAGSRELRLYDGAERVGPALVTNQWYFVAGRTTGSAASATGAIYLDGSTTAAVTGGAGNINITAATVYLGSDAFTSAGSNMDIAYVKWWDAALDPAELANEMRSAAPRRLENLAAWWPMLQLNEGTLDLSGNGRGLTAGSAASTIDGPPVSWRGRRNRVVYAPAGGGGPTTYFQVVDGNLTPSGLIVRHTSRALAAGITPDGALTQRTARALTAGITPAATAAGIKTALLSLAGAVTPAATLATRPNKAIGGDVTPSASITKHTARALTGGFTPTGALASVRTYLSLLTGGVTPSGDLAGEYQEGTGEVDVAHHTKDRRSKRGRRRFI